MIRNMTDLLNTFGVEPSGNPEQDERRLDRRVYKSTECGAWAKVIPAGVRPVGTKPETWTAKITNSILGARCYHVRRKGQGTITSTEAPKHVKDYLLLDQSHTVGELTWDAVRALPVAHGINKITVHNGVLYVTFTLDAPVLRTHSGGVVLGSIVEGSDAEVMPETLWFPFSESDFDRAIAGIEEEADRLWQEANAD